MEWDIWGYEKSKDKVRERGEREIESGRVERRRERWRHGGYKGR